MQYYVKVFNTKTNELVGYYKETGINCLSRMMNGIKYFNNIEEAMAIVTMLDDGFIRDKDKHYYTAHAVAYGDSNRQLPKEKRKTRQEKEEELKDALETFIRKNSPRNF